MTKPKKTRAKSTVSKNNSLKSSSKANDSEIEVDNVKVSFFSKIKAWLVSFFRKTRAWLNLNKVFFETVAATTLTIMAVVLAWSQLKVAREQTAYLEQQTTIERGQALPQFIVVSSQPLNDITNTVTNDKILVYNQGNIAREIIVRTAVFFKLTYINGADFQEALVPITGYFWITAYTKDATGLMAIIDNEGNVSKRVAIRDALWELAEKDDVIINMEVNRYVKLSYRDIFDALHIDYYYVHPVYGAELLEAADGENIFAQYQNGGTKDASFDLDKITAQDLYNLFK